MKWPLDAVKPRYWPAAFASRPGGRV